LCFTGIPGILLFSITRKIDIEKAKVKDSLLKIKEKNNKLNQDVDKQLEKLSCGDLLPNLPLLFPMINFL